jgi:hypothetical protein
MQTISKYCILSSTHVIELAAEVNEAIAQGWQPIGGPVVDTHRNPVDGQVYFHQAMVKVESEKTGDKRMAEALIDSVKQGELDKVSLLGLHSAVTFLGGIWTYPDRDPENRKLYEACRELESMGKLESDDRHGDDLRMIYFKPVLGYPVRYTDYLDTGK